MMNRTVRASIAVALCLLIGAVQADAPLKGDAEAGKVKAEACNACHGSNGLSINDMWPNLAGQKPGYIAKQLRSFRDGSRADPFMAQFAKPLTDQEIVDLAAHYARLEGKPLAPAAH